VELDQKKQWLLQRPSLCVSPYQKRDFRIVGNNQYGVTCCCNLDPLKGTPDQVLAASLQNQTHPGCQRCWQEEAHGHTSERMRTLMAWSQHDLEEFDRSRQLPKHQEPEVGMKFSNECNLACRSCWPHDSTLFAKVTNTPVMPDKVQQDLSEVPEYWNTILQEIDRTYQQHKNMIVHAIGGEPFVTKGFDRLVNWLCDTGIAAHVMLRCTTNFAVPIGDYWMSRFQQFRGVQIVASIDSVQENYNQVRWPAKWHKIEHNLDIWARAAVIQPAIFNHTCVIMVFTINNIFYLDTILDWWHQWQLNHSRVHILLLNIHVYRPDFLRPENLPDPYRELLLDKLQGLDHHAIFDQDRHVQLRDFIVNTRDQLQASTGRNQQSWHWYLHYTAEYDRRTGTDSTVTNARLFDCLESRDLAVYQQQFHATNLSMPMYAHQDQL
jgi:hypothetical protein